jgi:serine/threonine protein kinase
MRLVQNSRIAVGPYEIVHLLGEGGMAQVYLCVRRGAGQFEKRVVLKVLHPEYLGNQEYVSMFIHEARMLARLRHPNIVDVYEVDRVAHYPYLAMEFINGPTLGRLQKRAKEAGAYELGYLLHIAYQVCLGLHHAHTLVIDGRPAGIVHRDVSSQNILVDAGTGMAKLIDFGIAKTHEEELQTQIGVLKGKLAYMAPEVLRGQQADARADVYAVGVLLYRLVTDRLPFADGDGFSSARMSGRYPKPSRVAPGVSPQMEAIIIRALQPSPEDRYQTAEELASELADEIDRLGTNVRLLPQWLRGLFPGGEQDWSSRPGGDAPTRATAHSALSHLMSTNTMTVPRVNPRPFLLVALAGIATVFGFGVLGLLGGILFALSPTPSDGARDEVVTFLDAADNLLQQNQVEAARSMNTRAEALGVEDVQMAVRLANQRGAIERREAVLRASDRIQSGNLQEARQILVATLERYPSDDELRSQVSTLDGLMRAQAANGTAQASVAPPPPLPVQAAAIRTEERLEPARTARVEAAAAGEIRVSTTPPSLITLDGALVGLSPVTIPSVASGTHDLEAKLEGYGPQRATVEVRGGGVTPVELVLAPVAVPVSGPVAQPVSGPVSGPVPAPVPIAPVAPAPAPAPVAKTAPKVELPAPSQVKTSYEMHEALAPIAEALVSAGVDPALAKGVLADLESSNAPRLEADQVLRVNPRPIHDLVLDLANAGAARRDIQATLRKSFQSGALD